MKINIGLGEKAKDISAQLVSGKTFSLAQQKGRVVLILFWATWCEPCQKEMFELNKYYHLLKKKEFTLITINLDSSRNRMQEFIKKRKLGWHTIFSGRVWQDPTVKKYGVNSLPSTWLIDANGFLRSFELQGKELRQAIVKLLDEITLKK